MDIHELAKIHQDDHPGYDLTDWYEAAFPSYEVYLRVLMQVKQPVPAIEEFVMRVLDAGIETAEQVSGILGLQYNIVYNVFTDLHKAMYISVVRTQKNGKEYDVISITRKGRQLLQTLELLQSEEDNFNVCVDGLTGEYNRHYQLRTAQSIRQADLYQIKPYILQVLYDQLDVIKLRQIWREERRSQPVAYQNRDLINILAIDKAFLGYRQMRVLQFIRPNDGAIQIQVYDGRDRSQNHEMALLRMEQEGIRVLRAEQKYGPDKGEDLALKVIDPKSFEVAKQKATELPKIEQELANLEQKIRKTEELKQTSQIDEDSIRADKQKQALEVESDNLEARKEELTNTAANIEILSTIEHRPKLLQAIRDAKDRVIIVSPWLSPYVVNHELLDVIANATGKGVEVWIGYGFGEADHREKQTLDRLKEIQKKKGGRKLRLYRIGDSHAKVVICDDKYMITTSFNWLSFAGRQDWGNRIEFGTLVKDKRAVAAMLDLVMPLFSTAEHA